MKNMNLFTLFRFLLIFNAKFFLSISRLVVDTGLHTKGWPREKAIQFLVENTALDPELCLNQVMDLYYM